jgi:hypothetical protein
MPTTYVHSYINEEGPLCLIGLKMTSHETIKSKIIREVISARNQDISDGTAMSSKVEESEFDSGDKQEIFSLFSITSTPALGLTMDALVCFSGDKAAEA